MPQNNSIIKLSVVLCTYNGAKYIKEQLDSIINQTYPVYELLIFDDVSTDNTVELITEYATHYSFIRVWVNENNLGYTKNFEQALQAATGDAVSICDQDDVWIKDKLERMMHAWDTKHPLIYCNSYIFSGDVPLQPKEPVFRMFEGTDARKIFLANTISGHAIVCRKDFINLVVPFSKDAMYDWWMGVVAAYNGGVQHYDKVLVYQRSHAENSTVDILENYDEDDQKNIKKQRMIKQCRVFMTAPNIPPNDKIFLLNFANLLEESLNVKFHKPLYRFMVKHRRLLFNFKKKKIVLFSHVKHSYKWATNHKPIMK